MEALQPNSALLDDRREQTAEALRAFRDQAGETLNHHRERVCEIETRLNAQLQVIADELARERLADDESVASAAEQSRLLKQMQAAVAEKEAEIEAVLDELAEQSLAFELQLSERDNELEQVLQLGDDDTQQREMLQQELESAAEELETLRTATCTECEQLRGEITDTQKQLAELHDLQRNQLAQTETLQQELDEARQALEAERLRSTETQQQLDQTVRKFELARDDVHKLKRENAELHEELLSRPEADAQESAELVSLRAERDALADRITELENASAETSDADDQQEMADLQRRFEMAVDEVRELKQANADLHEQLALASAGIATPADSDALDWQARKAQLLASLDAEEQADMPENRREARATIEGTISITDRVVAEKDAELSKHAALLAEREAELEALRSQLDSKAAAVPSEALREQLTAEILDNLLGDDEAIQAEREKLQQQQQQLENKLREAELEISVQRATLAREQAAVDEKLARVGESEEVETDSDGKPRRRWLSALGIKEDPVKE